MRETVGDRSKRQEFDQCVSRKQFITKSDIRNIRVKVDDRIVKRHDDDATSVSMMVAELQQEPFNPTVIFRHPNVKERTAIICKLKDGHVQYEPVSYVYVL